jgi:aqualysin 1
MKKPLSVMKVKSRSRTLSGLAGLVVFLLVWTGCDVITSAEEVHLVDVDVSADVRRGIPGQYIVVLEPSVNAAAVAEAHGVSPRFTYSEALTGFAGRISDAARSGLLRDHRVVRIVPDTVVEISEETQSNPTWGLDRIDQRLRPLDNSYSFSYSGRGVTAYVFDTGIRFSHVEFGGRARAGFDAWGEGGDDCHSHGTHVAGTIGGSEFGVAKEANLVSVRIMDCHGRGSQSGIIAGIEWVIKNRKGPSVANFSIAGGKSEELNTAIRNLTKAGVHVAVAAGNNGDDACNWSPASTAEAVTVGGTNTNDSRRLSSNFGKCVDVFAPGSSILSAYAIDDYSTITKSGTSMATPHVAGVMAKWLEADPSLSPQQMHRRIVSQATKGVVSDSRSNNDFLLYSRYGTEAPDGTHPDDEHGNDEESESDDQGDGDSGNDSGDADESSETEKEVLLPNAPTDLDLTLPALNRVELVWAHSLVDADGFRIERRENGGAWTILGSVAGSSASYSDRTVSTGGTYTYRVRAFNSAGSSPYSNEAELLVACETRGRSLNCR